jgi:Sec-independent protein translocase protein TatA
MDIVLVLVIVLVIVLIWRGPKTLPLLGRAFGQGVREARREIDEIRTDASATPKDDEPPPPGSPPTPPTPPTASTPST